MSPRVDRLIKATGQLEALLRQPPVATHNRKPVTFERERQLCAEIRDFLVTNDFAQLNKPSPKKQRFNGFNKEDPRYAKAFAAAAESLLRLLNHSDEAVRSHARESLDTVFRSLMLSLNHLRLIVILITELNRNGPARCVVFALKRLAQVLHFSKSSRVMVYGVHVVHCVGVLLRRAEASLQMSLEEHAPQLLAVLGPRLAHANLEKGFELYRIAAENLDLAGAPNRAAVAVIHHVCIHYPTILKKAIRRCCVTLRTFDVSVPVHRLTGSMNLLKVIWPLAVARAEVPEMDLKDVLIGVLCCTQSTLNEVVVASLELLSVCLAHPLADMTFFPPHVANRFLDSSEQCSTRGSSPVNDDPPSRSSPSGSLLDVSCARSPTPTPNDPADESILDIPTEDGIIDPLLHADLFEEKNKKEEERCASAATSDRSGSPSPKEPVPTRLPSEFCSPETDCLTYAALLVSRRFLLAGLKGLRNDREVKISHKMLALSALCTAAARDPHLLAAQVKWDDCSQSLSDCARFCLHEDDQLAASAFALVATAAGEAHARGEEKYTDLLSYAFARLSTAFQPIRRRALVQNLVSRQSLLLSADLFSPLLDLVINSVNASYFLLQTSCVDLLSSLRWRLVPTAFRVQYEQRCLAAYFHLLFNGDEKVQAAATDALPRLIRNSAFGDCGEVDVHTPRALVALGGAPMRAVLGLSPAFHLSTSPHSHIDSNLHAIVAALVQYATEQSGRMVALSFALSTLSSAFPPQKHRNGWIASTGNAPGFLSTFLDVADTMASSTGQLVHVIRLLQVHYAAELEHQLLSGSGEKCLPKAVAERMILLPLRILNLFYSVMAEARASLSLEKASLLNRPSLPPINKEQTKKQQTSRIGDFSRLLGTSVHPTMPTSFLESDTLRSILPAIKGAHKNYMENMDVEQEAKLCELLSAGLAMLAALAETATLDAIKPILPEILLYLKLTMEVCPLETTHLLHQLFKCVFGKNAQALNTDTMKMLLQRDAYSRGNSSHSLSSSLNDFTSFTAAATSADAICVEIRRHLGWLGADLLSKQCAPPAAESVQALSLFEGYITQLIAIYQNYNHLETKKAILCLMCELMRDGVVYDLADPGRILFAGVLSQLEEVRGREVEMSREVFVYLIVLARNDFLPWDQVEKLLTDLVDKANDKCARHVLAAVDVVACEVLFSRKSSDDTLLTNVLKTHSRHLIVWAPRETLHLWTLLLHAARKDDTKLSSLSLDFIDSFAHFCRETRECSVETAYAAMVCLARLPLTAFRPIDSYFDIFMGLAENKILSPHARLNIISAVVFQLFQLPEDHMMVRLKALVDRPSEWIAASVAGAVVDSASALLTERADGEEASVLALRIVEWTARTGRVPKIASELLPALSAERALIGKLENEHDRVSSHWRFVLSQHVPASPDAESVEDSFARFSAMPAAEKMEYLSALSPVRFSLLLQHCTRVAEDEMDLEQSWWAMNMMEVHASRFPSTPLPSACVAHLKALTDELPEFASRARRVMQVCGIEAPSEPSTSATLTDCDLQSFFREMLSPSSPVAHSIAFRALVRAPTTQLYYVYETVPKYLRRAFLLTCVEEIERIVTESSTVPTSQREAGARAQELLDTVHDLVADDWNTHVALAGRLTATLVDCNLSWPDYSADAIDKFLTRVIQVIRHPTSIVTDAFSALAFFFFHPSVGEHFRRAPFDQIASIHELIGAITDRIVTTPSQPPESPRIEIGGVEPDSALSKQLVRMFEQVQLICEVYRQGEESSERRAAEKGVQMLLRHPVLHSMALVPGAALKMNWTPRLDVRHHSCSLPLVNIHLLCNFDVLQDFSHRVCWLGWTSRPQFESLWMSLFGVLSSTRTGGELDGESSASVADRVASSARAVLCLTDLLLMSLLWPEPGNPAASRFLVKHRDAGTADLHAKAMQHLSLIKARITGCDPTLAYKTNIERTGDSGDLYDYGQLSALSLWSMTGVLSNELTSQTVKAQPRASVSQYLLRMGCELDTASSVRALFENFSHWLSRGLHAVPLSLLTASLQSMTLLSDLFDEPSSYSLLFTQLRSVFNSRHLIDHPHLGPIIYSLMKAATVVGLDSMECGGEAELCKQMQVWVDYGLHSPLPSVRTATLHGIAYVLQSMGTESVRPLLATVSEDILKEIDKLLAVTDPIHINDLPSSLPYQTMLWSVAVRIMQEPVQVQFKQELQKKMCDALLVMHLPRWLLAVLTSSAEALLMHSNVYSKQLLAAATACFRDYTAVSEKFPFALRIFIACVFKESSEQLRSAAGRALFQPSLDETLTVLRKCDASDARLIAAALVSVLKRMHDDMNKVVDVLLELVLPVPCAHVSTVVGMIASVFEMLSDSQQLMRSQNLAAHLVRRVVAADVVSRDAQLAAMVLAAAVPDPDVACRLAVWIHHPHLAHAEWAVHELQKSCGVAVGRGGITLAELDSALAAATAKH